MPAIGPVQHWAQQAQQAVQSAHISAHLAKSGLACLIQCRMHFAHSTIHSAHASAAISAWLCSPVFPFLPPWRSAARSCAPAAPKAVKPTAEAPSVPRISRRFTRIPLKKRLLVAERTCEPPNNLLPLPSPHFQRAPLSSGPRHGAALFSAFFAGIGALLAVVQLVLAALRAACFADFRAETAYLMSELRATAHEGCRTKARLGAVAVEPDALRHFRHIAFLKARTGAMLAFLSTLNASCNARLEFVMSHRQSLCDR